MIEEYRALLHSFVLPHSFPQVVCVNFLILFTIYIFTQPFESLVKPMLWVELITVLGISI